jgi:hypothetical protein
MLFFKPVLSLRHQPGSLDLGGVSTCGVERVVVVVWALLTGARAGVFAALVDFSLPPSLLPPSLLPSLSFSLSFFHRGASREAQSTQHTHTHSHRPEDQSLSSFLLSLSVSPLLLFRSTGEGRTQEKAESSPKEGWRPPRRAASGSASTTTARFTSTSSSRGECPTRNTSSGAFLLLGKPRSCLSLSLSLSLPAARVIGARSFIDQERAARAGADRATAWSSGGGGGAGFGDAAGLSVRARARRQPRPPPCAPTPWPSEITLAPVRAAAWVPAAAAPLPAEAAGAVGNYRPPAERRPDRTTTPRAHSLSLSLSLSNNTHPMTGATSA